MTAAVFSLCLTGACLTVAAYRSARVEAKRAEARSLAIIHGNAIERLVDKSFSVTYILAEAVKRGGALPDFEALANDLLPLYPGIANMQLAPDGVVRLIAPLKGNEKAIGHDLFEDPERRADAVAARLSGRLTLAGPYALRQGGYGILVRLPVYSSREGGARRFWGFVSVMISMPEVLKSADLGILESQGYAWRLDRVSPGASGGYARASSSPQSPASATEWVGYRFEIAETSWELSLAPVLGWSSGCGTAAGLLFGLALSALVSLCFYFFLRSLSYHRLLDLILEAARIGIWRHDPKSGVMACSPMAEEIIGRAPGQGPATGGAYLALVHPEDRPSVAEDMELLRRGTESAVDCEERVLLPDGGYRWLSLRARAIPGIGRGSPSVIHGTWMDISAQKAEEASLKALNAEKTRLLEENQLLLREVHHRVKNNMSTVLSLLSIQAQSSPSDVVRAALADASARIESMMVLYDRLYRSESFRLLALRDYLSQLSRETVAQFAGGAEVALLESIEDVELEPSVIGAVGIAVVELLTNAMKYAFAGVPRPEIGVSAARVGGALRIAVSDNGRGIGAASGREGFGRTLLDALAAQLGGSFRYEPSEVGTLGVMEFPP